MVHAGVKILIWQNAQSIMFKVKTRDMSTIYFPSSNVFKILVIFDFTQIVEVFVDDQELVKGEQPTTAILTL